VYVISEKTKNKHNIQRACVVVVLAGQGRQRAASILRGDHELWQRFPGAARRHAERHAFRTVQRGVQRPVHPVVFN